MAPPHGPQFDPTARSRRIAPTSRLLDDPDPDSPGDTIVVAVEQTITSAPGRATRRNYLPVILRHSALQTVKDQHAEHTEHGWDEEHPPLWLDNTVLAHYLSGEYGGYSDPPRYDDLVWGRDAEGLDAAGLDPDSADLQPEALLNRSLHDHEDALAWAADSFLTPREAECWALVETRGLSARETGHILGISTSTVETHIASVRDKHDRLQATESFLDRYAGDLN